MRLVAAALFLLEDVHLGLELHVRQATHRREHLAALDLPQRAAKETAHVVARLALVEELAEHLHARDRGLARVAEAHDLHLVLRVDLAALDAPRHHRSAALDRERHRSPSGKGLSTSRTGSGMYSSTWLMSSTIDFTHFSSP